MASSKSSSPPSSKKAPPSSQAPESKNSPPASSKPASKPAGKADARPTSRAEAKAISKADAAPASKPASKADPRPASAVEKAGEPGAAAPAGKADAKNMQQEILKNLAIRLGLPLIGVWLFAAFFNRWWGYALAAALTAAAGGVVFWGWRRTEKTRKVADILQAVDATSKEGRQAALEKLASADIEKDNVAATLARAQLQMQDDPDKALRELESIDLTKILPAEADQVRFQRALIHLTQGDLERARTLVDPIDLSRHEDLKTRAIMAAVVAEAWGRTGQAKKGMELLNLYKEDDPAHAEIRLQLLRARAFTAASLNNMKEVRKALRKMADENPQYLGIFVQKKVHPLLAQEAKTMLMKSGAIPRQRPQMRYR